MVIAFSTNYVVVYSIHLIYRYCRFLFYLHEELLLWILVVYIFRLISNIYAAKYVYFLILQRRLARHWGAGVIYACSRRGYLKIISRIELCMVDKGFGGRQYQKTTLALIIFLNFSDPIVEVNAFGIQWYVTSVNEVYSTKNLAINVWKP
jgi:hypothetical protein